MTVQMIADSFSGEEGIRAVALSGSRTAAVNDSSSDYDLYVYSDTPLRREARKGIYDSLHLSSRTGISFFEEGDEAEDDEGNVFDIMFRSREWTEGEIEQVYRKCQAKIGYTTCILHNIATSEMLYDGSGWLSSLKDELLSGYPERLRENIIRDNLMIIDGNFSFPFIAQLELAVRRDDIVSQNHRLSAFLASYFDVLFAVNRVWHPGEKKLMRYAHILCRTLPEGFDEDIPSLLKAVGTPDLMKSARRAAERLHEIAEV